MNKFKDDELKNTIAYEQWKKYHDTFALNNKIEETLSICRKFYEGKQYQNGSNKKFPKPIMNICADEVDRKTAKICGTEYHVSFIADGEENMSDIDNFYSFQIEEMDDAIFNYRVCRKAYIDGTSIVFTHYDSDTITRPSGYEGGTKRTIVPLERFFVENPYIEDVQDQQYVGYYVPMEISSIRELVEGNEKERAEKFKLIVPEDFTTTDIEEMNIEEINNRVANVYFRFFRIEGEVYFEACTKYAYLYKYPHALNPHINEIADKYIKEYEKLTPEELDKLQNEKHIVDYNIDTSKYTIPGIPKKMTEEMYRAKKNKFYKYPVALFKPMPIDGKIIGASAIQTIVPNQQFINYLYLMALLIVQSQSQPKILAKPGALQGQKYDTSPNQVLYDYSKITENGGGWGISRLPGDNTAGSYITQIAKSFLQDTRAIYGFDNLEADSLGSDTSGFMYQQMVKQMNLTLEQPQKLFWHYIKENAAIDLMYYKFYINEASYLVRRSHSENELNETYRRYSQDLINSGKAVDEGLQPGTVLEPSKEVEIKKITKEYFDKNFFITMHVGQGIAGSEITESQHFNQIWQYVAQGNVTADKLRMLIENDPAITPKLRSKMVASLDQLENGQIAQLNAVIADLQQQLGQVLGQLKRSGAYINQQNKMINAQAKSNAEQMATANSMLRQMASSQPEGKITEGEAKSNNAKGIAGSDF